MASAGEVLMRAGLYVLGTLLAVALLAIWVLRHSLATARAKIPPTETPKQKQIDAEAQTERGKVEHASGQDLADQFSDRMLK